MELKDLQALDMAGLTKLYNELAEKQVKRFESRKKAEERTHQLLREQGKLDEAMTQAEAKNIAETAKAGVNTGTELRKIEPKKAAKKKAVKPQESRPAPKAGKGKGKTAGAAPAPTPAKGKKDAGKAPAKKRGAPTKNPTYTAISEKAKGYNPKGLRINPASARQTVLDFIKTSSEGKTREQIEKKFDETDINVPSSLYFLTTYGFAKVAE